MNEAQRKALQVFWNTLGIAVLVLACALIYCGMLWANTAIAESVASTSGARLVTFMVLMGVQLGVLVAVVRAWTTYRKTPKP